MAARPVVEAVARRDRDLASQVRRALSSVGLNVAEAFGSGSGNRRLRLESARGSAYEAQAALRIAVAWNHVSAADVATVLASLDSLSARIFGLSRR